MPEPDVPQWEGAVNARLLIGDIYRMGRSEWLTENGRSRRTAHRTMVDSTPECLPHFD
jgi:protein-tyrosine phosphatase